MLRAGKLCRGCKKECSDLGTQAEPIELECPNCDGIGCEHCDNGMFQVIGCPMQCSIDVMHFCKLADHFQKNLPPVSGGVLDQAASFLYAVDELRHHELEIRLENG